MHLVGFLLAVWPRAWALGLCDTGTDEDCDLDGYSALEGDCDDSDRSVRPGRDELCGDGIDNNCDGLYDEGCDGGVAYGQLQGGGGCTGGDNLGAWLIVLPILGRRRRR